MQDGDLPGLGHVEDVLGSGRANAVRVTLEKAGLKPVKKKDATEVELP